MADDTRDDEQRIAEILLRDDRYGREAYRFIQEALEFTVQRRGHRGHVTGKELLHGVKEYARERFGLMARTVLNQWGVKNTNDIGELVFNLVDAKVMSKQDSDTRADFDDVYDFEEVFDHDLKIEIDD